MQLYFQHTTILDAGAISGICLAVIGLSCVVSVAGVMLYRRRYINKPQTLSEPDSSGYIDDTTIRVCLFCQKSNTYLALHLICLFLG